MRDVCRRFGEYMTFAVPAEESSEEPPAQATNAFAQLMASSRAQSIPAYLPEEKGSATVSDKSGQGRSVRGDWLLFNEICATFKKAGLGFRRDQASTIGKRLITSLAEVLYEVRHTQFMINDMRKQGLDTRVVNQ